MSENANLLKKFYSGVLDLYLFENNFSSNFATIGISIFINGDIIKTNIITITRDGKPATKGLISEFTNKARGNTNMIEVNTFLE